MKSNFILALVSIAALTSIAFYGVSIHNSKDPILQESSTLNAECLNLTIVKVSQFLTQWDYWLNNTCERPKKFVLTYSNLYSSDPLQTLESECLASGGKQDTILMPDQNQIISAIQFDC